MTFNERFLKAKHWQLFLVTFGLPLIFQFIFMGKMSSSISSGTEPDQSTMFTFLKIYPLLILPSGLVFFGWFWSVAIGLQSKIPENVIMKVKKFKLLFSILLVYLLFINLSLPVLMNGFMTSGTEPSNSQLGLVLSIIIPLHLFSMFCIFYSLYFVTKTFKTVELQREVDFSDFAGEFFMIWFYPIGIWMVQPRINKMIEK
ncbi:hypothetical protein [uncultured Algoriphagus sp.]|uniref:hypothetical protein n=1 Tax=uncultured Algoriphagus sp. TaxID=417365 RepID=UPI0030EF8D06|tara:strand:+ start:3257 stop:3859 length:603 start_codon:yes stop_codon:yes gene_type:complete